MNNNLSKKKKSKTQKEKMATPEQIKTIENAVHEPIETFINNFINGSKKRAFSENLEKQLKRTQHISDLSSANGAYQPIYSEKLLQQININPATTSSYQIDRWLCSPQYYDEELRHLSEYLTYAVGQYGRAVWYLNTIKSFNYALLPSDSDIDGIVNKDEYMHAYDICLRTLQKLNVKYQIPKVDLQVMQDGVAFYWIDEKEDAITLLPLPADYCYITTSWTYGYMFAIDLTFFDQFITVPQQIPELYEAYKTFEEKREALYKGKDLAPYQYYFVPPDKGWCFTFDPVHPDKVPPLSGTMSASLDILSYKDLLKNKMALDLYKVIPLKMPVDDNGKMIVSYTLAMKILDAIRMTLPDNIKVFASPFEAQNAVLTDQSDRFDEILNVSNDTFYSSGGFTKSMFGSRENKMAASMQISGLVDYNYASFHMYRQYENFINFQLVQKTKKYKFQITMFGNALNKDKEIELALNTMTQSNNGYLLYYAARGYEPFQVKSTLLLEDALGLRDLMKPLLSSFNSKPSDIAQAGRPQQTTVGENGENTRNYDSNKNKFSLQKCLYCGKTLGHDALDGAFCNESCKEAYCLESIGEQKDN